MLAAKAHRLTADYDHRPPCPYAATQAQAYTTAGTYCTGVRYTSQSVKDIPLSSIYDFVVRQEVLGAASIVGKSIHELIRVVEAIVTA